MSGLAGALADFTTVLRREYGFDVAQRETADALRALDVLGLRPVAAVCAGLRAVYCTSADEAAVFDGAFERFFLGRRGVAQPDQPPRTSAPPVQARERQGAGEAGGVQRREAATQSDTAAQWEAFRARYSPGAGRGAPPVVALDGLEDMMRAVRALVGRVRITTSRRRIRDRRGRAVDLRRTLRSGVATVGEPIELYRTSPSPRGARFVLLIDGSRSMGEENGPALQFAHALCRTTRRANAFVFSTALSDITPEMRNAAQRGRRLGNLEDAWGGGTRIGECLSTFVGRHGRLVRGDTIVLIFSDGLDVGSLDALERALRDLSRSAYGILWVHPAAGRSGFAPEAGGLRTALPFITGLAALRGAADVPQLVRAISAPAATRRLRAIGPKTP